MFSEQNTGLIKLYKLFFEGSEQMCYMFMYKDQKIYMYSNQLSDNNCCDRDKRERGGYQAAIASI